MVAIAFSAFFKDALQVLNEVVCVTIKLVYCHLAPSKLQFISINCEILLHFNNKGAVTKIDLKRRTKLAKLVNAWPLEEDSCLSLKSIMIDFKDKQELLMIHEACTFYLIPNSWTKNVSVQCSRNGGSAGGSNHVILYKGKQVENSN